MAAERTSGAKWSDSDGQRASSHVAGSVEVQWEHAVKSALYLEHVQAFWACPSSLSGVAEKGDWGLVRVS